MFSPKSSNETIRYDYNRLVGRIIEKYGTRETFAKAFGCSVEHLSRFLNNKWYLKQPSIDRMSALLEIPDNEVYLYFFVKDVQNN